MLSNSDDISDEALMMRVQSGDHEAFSFLVQRHSQRFYACAYRICHSAELSEDVVQDAFFKLWRKPDGWASDKGVKFTTWFYRVVSNQAIDVMRKAKFGPGEEAFQFLADENADQHEDMERQEQEVLIERAIAALPDRQKLALNLCFYEGLSNKDAADVMEVGVKALESLLMRAKANLRDVLIREEGKKYG